MADGKKGGFFSWFGRRKRETEAAGADTSGSETANPQQPPNAKPAETPACPKCGASMYQRFDLQARAMQWGCINYPACKGTRAM